MTYLEVSMPAGVEAVQGIAGGFGLSPDGRTLGLIGVRDGTRRLYTRSLDEPEAVEVTGSSGINSVAFSPDGASVAFVVGTLEVVRYSIADRQRQVVAQGADLGSTVAWGESGIYFSREGAIWRVSAEGGTPEQVTHLDAGRHEVIHIDPVEPPGSGRLFYTSLASASDSTRVESVALADRVRSVVLERAATPVWSTSGHLLFEREGAVWAIRVDARRGTASGRAVRLLEAGLLTALRYGSLPYRVSATGTLAYMPRVFDQKRMVAVDRRGAELAFAIPPDSFGNPRPSPDGRRILFERDSVMEVLDVERGTRTQLAQVAFGTNFGTWTSDGRRVVLRRYNTPHWVAADGSGLAGEIPGGSVNDYPHAPGPDPDSFIAVRVRPETAGDIFLFSISGTFEPRALVATPAYEGGAQLSPDRKWLVYQSNESGRPEIYVRRYPQLDRAWQVSEGGGVQTRWSADGREIFFRTGEALMAASFVAEADEPRLGKPVALFPDEYDFGQGLSIPNYDVLADGRFVFFRRTPAGGRLRLVQNWRAELERKLAAEGER
jgi:serine/threonine-protein kinase